MKYTKYYISGIIFLLFGNFLASGFFIEYGNSDGSIDNYNSFNDLSEWTIMIYLDFG